MEGEKQEVSVANWLCLCSDFCQLSIGIARFRERVCVWGRGGQDRLMMNRTTRASCFLSARVGPVDANGERRLFCV